MDFIKENRAAIVVAVLIAGMVTMGVIANNSSDTNKGDDAAKTSETKDKESGNKADKNSDNSAKNQDDSSTSTLQKTDKGVSITAKAGDSYTTLARQAVQDADSSLSKAQVIAAETFLTQNAGEPAVNVDQAVLIKQADLDKAIKKAKGLSKADIAAWKTYVPYVAF